MKVTVYCYEYFDGNAGEYRPGARRGTLEAIERFGHKAIRASAQEVEEHELDVDRFVKPSEPPDA